MKNIKGITLISLVITIIVIIILCTAALNFLFGNEGILKNAQVAQEQYNRYVEREAIEKAFAKLQIKVYVNEEEDEITVELLVNQLNLLGHDVIVEKNEQGNFVIIFKDTGDSFEVTPEGEILGEDKVEIAVVYEQEIGATTDFSCTNDYQEYEIKDTGFYQIECWGASGGYSRTNGNVGASGGKGGYTAGIIKLDKGEKIYVYVGGQGADAVTKKNSEGGYNGGGLGTWDNSDDEAAGAGGGATDIRLVSGDWDDFDSLKSRIMVAGGGGGSSWNTSGGSAGGLEGFTNRDILVPGKQTTGYKFGIGQDGYGTGDNDGVAGSGSGYYGGTTNNRADGKEAGAGGSSYISGYDGCDAISESSTENNITHTNQSIHYSGKQFINTTLIDGKSKMPNVETGEEEIGHQGDGHARIMFLGGNVEGKGEIPVYTPADIMKIGSGEIVYDSIGKGTYTYGLNKTYALQNDITVYGDTTKVQNLIDSHQVTINENGHTLILANCTNPEYFSYSTTETAATITGFSEIGRALYNEGELTEIILPNADLQGLEVIGVGGSAFNGFNKLEIVKISDGITSLGYDVFKNCTNLRKVIIASSVVNVSAGYDSYGWGYPGSHTPFMYCSKLKEVEFTGTWTTIPQFLFAQTGIEAITIPSTVTTINQYAFSACNKLATISIPSGLTNIKNNAFWGCSSLTGIALPNGLVEIGSNAFNGCSSFTQLPTIPTSVTSLGVGIFRNCHGLTTVTVPAFIGTIPESMFEGSNGLTTVTIPDGITTLGKNIFKNCKTLNKVIIASSVVNVTAGYDSYGWGYPGSYTPFMYCSGLKEVEFTGTWTTIPQFLFAQTGLETITIPSTVTSINQYAFCVCNQLRTITIPSGLTNIKNNAFWGCSSLTGITLPNGLVEIGSNAFNGCSSFTQLPTIPTSVTSLGVGIFRNCHGLTTVTVPAFIGTIPESMFEGSNGLTTVTIPDGITTLGKNIFKNCKTLNKVIIASSVVNVTAGYDSYGWGYPGSYTPFMYCSGLKEVEFTGTWTTIPQFLFAQTGLETITIPSTVTNINQYAFCVCNQLSTISIPSGLTNIKNNAFWGCSSLTGITLPNGLVEIGSNAFNGCSSFTQLPTIPTSVTSFGSGIFKSCTGLTVLTVPNYITTIPNSMFESCTGLTTVTIPDGVTTLGQDIFKNCTNLNKAIIASSVVNVTAGYDSYGWGYPASHTPFMYCSKLKEVEFTGTWTSIPKFLFAQTGLETITIPSTVTSIGANVFHSATQLATITIPNSVMSIDNNAFRDCSSLQAIVFTGTNSQWSSINKGSGNDLLFGNIVSCTDDAQKNLRSNNTDIAYIESAGSQFIKTTIIPTDTMGVYLKVSSSNISSDLLYLGSKKSGNNSRFTIGNYQSKVYMGWNTTVDANLRPQTTQNEINEIELNFNNSRKMKFNGTDVYTISSALSSSTAPIAIFAGYYDGSISYKSSIKLYELKITEGTEIIHNFIPVYNTIVNQAGLYDTIDEKFYYSNSNSAFIKPQ